MQFSLFVHMERCHPSQTHRQLHDEWIELCQMADDGGMRAVWTGEHHGMEFTIAPNPFLSLVDIAHHTRRVRLGTGTVVAPFWHPVRLAGEAALADLLTGGRLELGVARGAYSYEYERLMPGMDAWQAGQRMRETVPLLRPLWQGDCTNDGEFYPFPATTTTPRPLQAEGPPIWIAARDPASHAFAVEQGCHVQVTPLWQGEGEIASLMQRFNDACANSDMPRPRIMLLHHTYVARDDDDLASALTALNRFFCTFGAWFQNQRPVRQGMIEPLSAEEIAANTTMSRENLARDLTVGRADAVIERLRRYQDLGFDEFSYWIDSGMDHRRKRESLARFIDEVMPAFS